jgi:hypothetical protein
VLHHVRKVPRVKGVTVIQVTLLGLLMTHLSSDFRR